MESIAENLAAVRERIARAAGRSARRPEDIALIVVTKTIDVPSIREAIAAGATDLGENYVQEAHEKWLILRPSTSLRTAEDGPAARWHFIGHLQRNKAKLAVEMFETIQCVDSLALAEEIGRRALARSILRQAQDGMDGAIDVLIEVNLAGEETKFGIRPEDALGFAEQIAHVPGIRLQGFMGMAPFVDDPEDARGYFARLKSLWDRLPDDHRRWLSMGMSHDFEVAIEEGSNMVRIGTAVFGPRAS